MRSNRTEDMLEAAFANFDTEITGEIKMKEKVTFIKSITKTFKTYLGLLLIAPISVIAVIIALYPIMFFLISITISEVIANSDSQVERFGIWPLSFFAIYVLVAFPITKALWDLGFGEKVWQKFKDTSKKFGINID